MLIKTREPSGGNAQRVEYAESPPDDETFPLSPHLDAPAAGGDRILDQGEASLPAHPHAQIPVLEQGRIGVAAQPFENAAADENSLIPEEKPVPS